jgi:hypothetical protein
MYGWEESYQRAMLETDRSTLPGRIEAAKTAIDRRLQEINAGHDSEKGASQFEMPWLASTYFAENSSRT